MAKEMDRQRHLDDPNFKGAFHEKKEAAKILALKTAKALKDSKTESLSKKGRSKNPGKSSNFGKARREK